jgi:hypothetical protein
MLQQQHPPRERTMKPDPMENRAHEVPGLGASWGDEPLPTVTRHLLLPRRAFWLLVLCTGLVFMLPPYDPQQSLAGRCHLIVLGVSATTHGLARLMYPFDPREAVSGLVHNIGPRRLYALAIAVSDAASVLWMLMGVLRMAAWLIGWP